MRRLFRSHRTDSTNGNGIWPIAVGLSIFMFDGWLPQAPTLTAMALVTFGATYSTIERFGRQPAFGVVLVAHLWVYSALYLLLLNALWQGSATSFTAEWGLFRSLDLAASGGLMVAAIRTSLAAIREQHRGPDATRF